MILLSDMNNAIFLPLLRAFFSHICSFPQTSMIRTNALRFEIMQHRYLRRYCYPSTRHMNPWNTLFTIRSADVYDENLDVDSVYRIFQCRKWTRETRILLCTRCTHSPLFSLFNSLTLVGTSNLVYKIKIYGTLVSINHAHTVLVERKFWGDIIKELGMLLKQKEDSLRNCQNVQWIWKFKKKSSNSSS